MEQAFPGNSVYITPILNSSSLLCFLPTSNFFRNHSPGTRSSTTCLACVGSLLGSHSKNKLLFDSLWSLLSITFWNMPVSAPFVLATNEPVPLGQLPPISTFVAQCRIYCCDWTTCNEWRKATKHLYKGGMRTPVGAQTAGLYAISKKAGACGSSAAFFFANMSLTWHRWIGDHLRRKLHNCSSLWILYALSTHIYLFLVKVFASRIEAANRPLINGVLGRVIPSSPSCGTIEATSKPWSTWNHMGWKILGAQPKGW